MLPKKVKVNIYSCQNRTKVDQVHLPNVFISKIKPNIVNFVHSNMRMNRRQPHSVNNKAGTMTSASSWGTGRALARVPRISGSGTHKSGQGATVNSCRGGRIFGPNSIWRKWHHKINKNQRKQALESAIAATGISALIAAHGYNLNNIPEIPLVVENSVELLKKTKNAQKVLSSIGIRKNNKLNCKKKTYSSSCKKLLIIYQKNAKCFRNIFDVETCRITTLNLFKLAPGGHLGRLCMWTHFSFCKLDLLFGLKDNLRPQIAGYKLGTKPENLDAVKVSKLSKVCFSKKRACLSNRVSFGCKKKH
ncbi:60S ribosomal protein L1 (nucleomorph) [Cryptomonas paramecium]|uniref:60S ribosomal protein L1 n=1 Tax=Cryptomonas paramaecium TaxID=2898 RepID=F2HI94_9CRYP|nr:60S ribosomal protein L1 [Cryptomonas paramecium]AEA39018.1 60S ribosomal protein L1 [Cryptomonas paramecium]|mmetsp:Transcript_35795/g.93910  ORF Transcript_35795/g.93910 Transcript_35795/m.93910 type:complete len:305 (-) Transcript_35795:2139-3053(-)